MTIDGSMPTMTTAQLLKAALEKKRSVVVLPIDEYNRLLAASSPTYYLKGKAALRLDKLVEKSMREYYEGKTIKANSLGEAVKKWKAHAR